MAFKGGVVLGTVSLNATGTGTTNIGATSNSGTISIGNTSSGAVAIDCGTAGITVGTTANAHSSTFGSTNSTSATTLQSGSGALNVTSTNGTLTINSGTGALDISNDASATTVSIATGGAVKTTTLGSTNSTSATTVQSGSGALNITSTNGALTINSGTGTLSVSSDASAATVNLATGAAAKVVTLGSTNGASSLALKFGTADMTMASATGTVWRSEDTGEITMPLQPAFLGYLTATVTNVTGDGTIYTVLWDAERFDQNADFNTGTGTFTAPVTGKYHFESVISYNDIGAAHTQYELSIVTSNETYVVDRSNPFIQVIGGGTQYSPQGSILADMDAADTCTITTTVYNSTKTVDVASVGNAGFSSFSGYLAC